MPPRIKRPEEAEPAASETTQSAAMVQISNAWVRDAQKRGFPLPELRDLHLGAQVALAAARMERERADRLVGFLKAIVARYPGEMTILAEEMAAVRGQILIESEALDVAGATFVLVHTSTRLPS